MLGCELCSNAVDLLCRIGAVEVPMPPSQAACSFGGIARPNMPVVVGPIALLPAAGQPTAGSGTHPATQLRALVLCTAAQPCVVAPSGDHRCLLRPPHSRARPCSPAAPQHQCLTSALSPHSLWGFAGNYWDLLEAQEYRLTLDLRSTMFTYNNRTWEGRLESFQARAWAWGLLPSWV